MYQFFIYYLAALCPTLGHYRGHSITQPILITTFIQGSLTSPEHWGLNQKVPIHLHKHGFKTLELGFSR